MDIYEVLKKCMKLQYAYFTNSSRAMVENITNAAAMLEGSHVDPSTIKPLSERLAGIKVSILLSSYILGSGRSWGVPLGFLFGGGVIEKKEREHLFL